MTNKLTLFIILVAIAYMLFYKGKELPVDDYINDGNDSGGGGDDINETYIENFRIKPPPFKTGDPLYDLQARTEWKLDNPSWIFFPEYYDFEMD